LEDEDFRDDFAMQLYELMDNLDKECDVVMADCLARKQRLTDAIIWPADENLPKDENPA
jgi:hypothetical protein